MCVCLLLGDGPLGVVPANKRTKPDTHAKLPPTWNRPQEHQGSKVLRKVKNVIKLNKYYDFPLVCVINVISV